MITKNDLIKDIKKSGLKKGDIVIVHSALSSIGKIKDGADTLLAAFLDVLGPEGTIAAPIFGDLGIFTKTIANHKRSVWSDGAGQAAAIGKDAEFICKDHHKAKAAHGEGSPYVKIADLGGYVMLLGVDQDRNTTLHTTEELCRMPYLSTREFQTKTKSGKILKRKWKLFPGPHRDFIGIDKILRNSGKMKTGNIGNAVVRLIKSRDLIDIIVKKLKEDPAVILCDNPECSDCVRQKAKITKAKLKKEKFLLGSSSSLAGIYIDEIIENMKKSGIENIELDFIQRKHILDIPEELLKEHLRKLKAEKIKITGIRTFHLRNNIAGKADILSKLNIKNITLPLAEFTDKSFITAFTKKGITLCFENRNTDMAYSQKLMENLKGKNVIFAFNPACLAFTGCKPFLTGFRTVWKRYTNKLYINDGTFYGKYTDLAKGNAEIKEIISILRCKSFSGQMILENTLNPPLLDRTRDFLSLLENM